MKEYRSLTEEQCGSIVDTAIRILSDIGADVEGERAIEVMKAAGCSIDGTRVRVPESVVRSAIDAAPNSVTLYDRSCNPAIKLAGQPDRCYYAPGTSAVNRLDPRTGERRAVSKADILEASIVEDRLQNMDLVCGLGYIEECDPRLAGAWELRYMLEGTSKPCTINVIDVASLEVQLSLGEAVRGNRQSLVDAPMFLSACFPLTPLRYDAKALENLLYIAELGLPVSFIGTPGICSTGPATIAGSIALGLADSLFGLVLTQQMNSGAPYVVTSFVDQMDLRRTCNTMSSPEFVKASAVAADVFRYLDLPALTHIGSSDALAFDQQAALDITASVFAGEQNRVGMNFFYGYLEGGMNSSLESLAFANEVIDYVRAYFEPIEVDEDTLAFEVMEEVLPGGDFLAEDHTIDHMNDFFNPNLIMRDDYDKWTAAGSPSISDRARAQVLALIEQGPREPLPAEVVAKLDAIMEEAERKLA